MADDFNNNRNDEVVDSVPKNTRNINDDNISDSSQNVSYTQTTQNSSVQDDRSDRNVYADDSLMSIICLGLGIFSVICCCSVIPAGISAIIGLVVGIIALRKNCSNKAAAITGIILCSIGLAMFLLYAAFSLLVGSLGYIFNMPAAIQPKAM